MFLVFIFPDLFPKGINNETQNVHSLCISLKVQQELGIFVETTPLLAVGLGIERLLATTRRRGKQAESLNPLQGRERGHKERT